VIARWGALLDDVDPDVRFESASGLIQINPANKTGIAVLASFLDDLETQPVMLAAILKAYRQIDPAALNSSPSWTRLLQHEQAVVREETARTLGHWGSRSANVAAELLPLLDDEEPFVREEAAKSLERIGVSTPEILAALQAAAGDEDEIVAGTAQQAMQQLSR
jgi:HEAT repeat protein